MKLLDIANFILYGSNRTLFHENDLTFAYNEFLESEDYEKCAIINKLIKTEKFDNTKESFINLYLKIFNQKKNIKNHVKILKELQEENDLPADDILTSFENLLIDLDKSENNFWHLIQILQQSPHLITILQKKAND